MTAQKLSEELEVSVRTIYRDVIALSTSGIPIYTQDGPGGGIALIDDYQTKLTGLLPEEAQALSILDIPEPLLRLGIGQELKNALLKLSAAIEPVKRGKKDPLYERIYLDAAWWFQEDAPSPNLEVLKQAINLNRLVDIQYQMDFNTTGKQIVAPYGLVAKANIWYLVYEHAEKIWAKRIARINSAVMLKGNFTYPMDFNLVAFWKKWCSDFENIHPIFEVQTLVHPALANRLPTLLKENQPDRLPVPLGKPKTDWIPMALHFENFETARSQILGFGAAIQVVEPIALRSSVIDYAKQIQLVYLEENT